MEHILDILKERGFLAQMTFEDELYEQLKTPTTFYVGFDPTADSLHIGHYIPIMAMAHMQKAGHKPIALMGGGTAMIGDPSGKTDMRKMLTVETIDQNVECIKKQMSRFLDFSEGITRDYVSLKEYPRPLFPRPSDRKSRVRASTVLVLSHSHTSVRPTATQPSHNHPVLIHPTQPFLQPRPNHTK